MPRQKSAKSYEFQTVLVLSLKLHYRRHWEAVVGNLMEVVLGQTVRSYGHPQGGRREVIPHHWRWEGSERPDGTVKLVLQRGVVLLLQRPALFRSPVLEPNLNLKTIKHYNSVSDDFSGSTHLSLRQTDHVGQLGLPPDGDVAAVVELLLQLQPLVVAVDDPVLVLCPCSSWKWKISFSFNSATNHSFDPKN